MLFRQPFVLLYRTLGVTLLLIANCVSPASAQFELNDINPFGDDPVAEEAAPEGEEPPPQQTVEEVFAEGKQLADAGKCAEAIEFFSRILAAAPNYAPAALERGKCLAEIGETQLALESLSQAVNYGQRFPEVYAEALLESGKVKLKIGNYEEAVDDFSLAVQTDPSNADFAFYRGKALIRLARLPLAASPGGAGELYAQAIASLDRAIELREDFADAYAERGEAQSVLGQFDRAVSDLERAVALDGENTLRMAQLGFVLLRRGDAEKLKHNANPDLSVADYREAINAFSAYLAIEGGKTKEDFEDADPEFILPGQVFLARAVANIALGSDTNETQRFAAAVEDATSSLDFDDTLVTALFQKGVAERLLGNFEAAADSFRDAIQMNARFAEAYLRRGIVFFYLGNLEAARGDFQQVMEVVEAPDGRAEFWTGVTFAKEGRYGEAIRMFSRTIRINPGFKPAYSNRGLIFMRQGRYSRAAADFNELLRRNHHDSVARQRRDQAVRMMNQTTTSR